MAITINKAFTRTFEGVVRFLAQQSDNKLRGTVLERGNGPGEDHVFEYVGPVEFSAAAKTRRQTTPEIDTPWSNRIVSTNTYDVGDTVEKEDKLKMIIEPTSTIAQNYAKGARRKFDDLIIKAADPTTNAIDKDAGVIAFPAAQEIGDGTAEMSFDLLTEIREKALKKDIDPDEDMFAVVGPTQIRKLMHEPKATNADYVAFQAIQAGKFAEKYMGFRWIVTNRLLSQGAGRVNCLFYARGALGLKVDEEVSVEIDKDPSKSFMWRVYARLTAGATRVDDDLLWVFDCKDTATV